MTISNVSLNTDSPTNLPIKNINDQLPPEMLDKIFSYLDETSLMRSRLTCKLWYDLTYDHIKKLIPIFGKEEWKEYLGDPGNVPPIPADIIKIFSNLIKSMGKTKDDFILVLIPKTVNGQNFSLKWLRDHSPINFFQCDEGVLYNPIVDKYAEVPVENSYWVIMTKNALNGTQLRGREQQKVLVEKIPGCRLPKMIEVATSALLQHRKTKEILFNFRPNNQTCCDEKYHDDRVIFDNHNGILNFTQYVENFPVGAAAAYVI